MNKISFFIFILSFTFFTGKSQVTSMPSSSAFSLTKYANANVNESSGKVTTAIHLLNYQAGKIQVPVSLNYIGNGVKVAQQSNWVGTNWNLNAGGVVTRIVNGYPDEKASVRLFLEDLGDPAALLDSDNYILQPNDTRDYRADIFSFSFAGYSGSFYLDKFLVPHLTNNDSELKIEFLGGLNNSNTNTIVIITPNGVKYFFGGTNASENSGTLLKKIKRADVFSIDPNDPVQVIVPIATTAFFLYKIENNFGDIVLIDYYDDGIKNFLFTEQQQQTIPLSNISSDCLFLHNYLSTLKKFVYTGSIYNSKKIKKIYSLNSNLEVLFNSDQLLLLPDVNVMQMQIPQYDDRKLNSIHLYNKLISKNLKNIVLDYLLPSPLNTLKNRFFLEKVSINNNNSITDPKCEIYKMEYNSPEDLPNRFSYDIDLMGYYNGETNQSLIDNNYYNQFTTTNDLTVRDSNFEFATKGVLNKMFYPSGGYTIFEYERPYGKSNTVSNIHLSVYQKVLQEPIHHQSGVVMDVKNTDIFNVGIEPNITAPQSNLEILNDTANEGLLQTGFPPITIYEDTRMSLVLITSDSVQHPFMSETEYAAFLIDDLTLNTRVGVTLPFNSTSGSGTRYFDFDLIKDHKYTFSLVLNHPNMGHNTSSDAYLTFKSNQYIPASGIRVKRVKEFTDSQQTNVKRFYYKKAHDIGKFNDNSGIMIYEPKLNTKIEAYQCTGIGSNAQTYETVSLTSNPFSNVFASSDNQIEYQYVTTSFGGDNFEEGGIERHYRIEKNDEVAKFFVASGVSPYFNFDNEDFGNGNTNNKSSLNGTLLKELILETKNNKLYVKQKKDYTYDLTVDHNIKNFIVSTTLQGQFAPSQFVGSPSIGQYTTFSYRHNLKNINTKTFTAPVAVGSLDPINFISDATDFDYTVLRGLPSKISTKDSKGKTLTKRFYYPVASNVSLLSGLSSADIANYNVLKNQNNINFPIQVETYSKDNSGIEKLLLTKRSLFKDFSGKILPFTEQVAKSNNPLYSNTFLSEYDTNGNLVEVTQENQFKKSTLYGYNNTAVIAELPNVSYASISPGTIATLKTLSDNVIDQASMNALETQLNTLRTIFPNAQITTYVYNPTGQLDSVTDARGRKITYVYDDCKRLKVTKDNEGNIIEEYKYNLLNN